MAPIIDKAAICNGKPPEVPCFYYRKFTTLDGLDGNWNLYKITNDYLPVDYCSNIINPADPSGGGVYNYAQTLGINGISDCYFELITGPGIGGIVSYFGNVSQQSLYNFIITNSTNSPVVTYWQQGLSCTPKCFEHPFQKPDFVIRTIQCDSVGDINLAFGLAAGSPWNLDLVISADVANLEKILQNIYGPQVVVFTQTTGSGNIILRIENIYTDQITVNLLSGTSHIMAEVPCS